MGVVVTLVFASLIMYDFVLHDGLGGGLVDAPTLEDVHHACNEFVVQRLDRRPVSFAPIAAAIVTLDGRSGTDLAYVEVPTAVGTGARVPFTCEVRYDGDGSWSLTHLDVTDTTDNLAGRAQG